jgi:hypothetical protein
MLSGAVDKKSTMPDDHGVPCGRVRAVGCLATPARTSLAKHSLHPIPGATQIFAVSEFCISTAHLQARCGKQLEGGGTELACVELGLVPFRRFGHELA